MAFGLVKARRRLAARWAPACFALAAGLLAANSATAQFVQPQVPEPARGLDITEKVGAQVPLDLPLVASDGREATLGSLFNQGRPVVLALAYYDCPVACPAVFDAMTRCFNGLDFEIGSDFSVAVVSFDPTNTPLMAAKARSVALAGYDRPKSASVERGWEFFTAAGSDSRRLADAVGFQYRLLEDGEYSHPIGIFVLTPAGSISRYFYAFEFPPKDMKLALMEASEGKLARTIGDRLLLFCYHYDPKTGTYTFAAYRLMQAGAILTLILLAGTVGLLKAAESRRRADRPAPPEAGPGTGSLDPAFARLDPSHARPALGRQG